MRSRLMVRRSRLADRQRAAIPPLGAASVLMCIPNSLQEKNPIVANKAETIKAVAAEAGVSASDAERTLSAFFDLVAAEAKAGGKVTWPGFGSFSMSERGARMGRNPQTGESIEIGPSRSLKLATAAAMKKQLMS